MAIIDVQNRSVPFRSFRILGIAFLNTFKVCEDAKLRVALYMENLGNYEQKKIYFFLQKFRSCSKFHVSM